jgi:hypothetical protein
VFTRQKQRQLDTVPQALTGTLPMRGRCRIAVVGIVAKRKNVGTLEPVIPRFLVVGPTINGFAVGTR